MILNIGCGAKDSRGDVRIDISRGTNASLIADIRHLPFRENVFSIIICQHVLEHLQEDDAYGVRDQTVAIDEMYRVLKASGVCHIVVPWGWEACAFDHKRIWPPSIWRIMLDRSGFRKIEIRGRGSIFDFQNGFLDYIFHRLPLLKPLT